MRKSKIIEIEGRGEITIKEVSVMGVYRAITSKERKAELIALLDDALSMPAVTIAEWYPSEIEAVIDGLTEINSSFFGVAQKLRVDGLLQEMTATVKESLPMLFADSLEKIIRKSGTTAGSSS